MFEQTLLTHPPVTRKSGALFASFLAQILLGGVLLIAPLIFTDVLPMLHVGHLERLVPPGPVTPPPPVERHVVFATRTFNPFARLQAPTAVPQGPVQTIIDAYAPALPTGLPSSDLFTGLVPSSIVVPAPTSPKPVVAEPAPPKLEPPPTLLRVSEGAQLAKLIKRVLPVYPALGRQMRVSGTVQLLGIIGKDGRIRDLKVLSGHPLLREAAREAVAQWVYSPTVLSGQPVEVEAPIEVNFTLR